MHLELVLSNIVNLDYQWSVIDVFNLAIAMAALEKKQSILTQYNAAQTIMGALITSERGPSLDEGDFLGKYFNMIDRHIGIQSAAALVRTIEFVDRMIAKNAARKERVDAEALSTRLANKYKRFPNRLAARSPARRSTAGLNCAGESRCRSHWP